MILGTHTSRTAQDYLMIAEVILPKPSPNEGDPLADYDQEKGGKRAGRRMYRENILIHLHQRSGHTTPIHQHASRSFSESITRTKSIELDTCRRMQT